MPRIPPTVGRKVWYRPDGPEGPILDATVCFVHSDSCVNLGVRDHNGVDLGGKTSVTLVQEGETPPAWPYCEWMPYQKGQAAKTEAAETKVGAGG